jgi:predicted nucleotidyltransferase
LSSEDETDLANIISVLQSQSKIRQLVLFGSRAKGTHRPGSDWDIALKGDDISLAEVMELQTKITDLWLANQVDLIVYDDIENLALKEHIDRVGIVVWRC